jgi:hypothetical protein
MSKRCNEEGRAGRKRKGEGGGRGRVKRDACSDEGEVAGGERVTRRRWNERGKQEREEEEKNLDEDAK